MNTKLIVRLLGYLIALSGVFVYAQEDPRLWGAEGLPLRAGDHLEWRGANALNEFGQTCIAWCDAREGYWDIYAQVIAPDGCRLWTAGGLLVNNAEWRQEDPAVIAVEGGWIIAWIDWRYGDRFQMGPPGSHPALFAQKLSLTGERLWTTDGVEVFDTWGQGIFDLSLVLTDDRAGGAIIGWRENQSEYIFRTQRVGSSGTLVWNEPVIVANELDWGSDAQVVSDAEGNMIVVWDAQEDSVNSIFGAKITLVGTLPWGDGVNGIPLESITENCSAFEICKDETTNGFYVIWGVPDVYYHCNYYAQRYDVNGTPLWGNSGILLFGPADRLYYPRISPSYSSGVQDGIFVVGPILTELSPHLVVQKLDLNGTLLWGAGGINAGELNGYNTWDRPVVQTDFDGGCIALWSHCIQDPFTSKYPCFLKAARLDDSGNPLWGNGGVMIHQQPFTWRFRGVLSYIENSDFARALFMDTNNLGYKSILFENGSQVSESAVRIRSAIQGEACEPASVALADARVAIVWKDERDYNGALYYQITDTLGTPLLGSNGRRLVPYNDTLSGAWGANTPMCSDGQGGFFAAALNGYSEIRSLYVMHVDADESPIPDPSRIILSDSASGYEDHFIVSDGAGGCYAVWNCYTPEYASRIMIQRLSDQCEPLWPAPMELAESDIYAMSDDQLRETSDGCCVVFWYSGQQGDRSATAAKINRSGEIVWSLDICENLQWVGSMSCEPDLDGGMYFVWDAPYETEESGIYSQHVDTEGHEQFAHNGIQIHASDGTNPISLYDEQYGLYVFWKQDGVFAQRLDENGTALWAPGGLQIGTEAGSDGSIHATRNQAGGFFCIWTDYTDNMAKLYGADILPDGTPTSEWWTEGAGNLIAEHDRQVWGTQLTPFGDGSSLIVWEGVIYGELSNLYETADKNEYYYIDLYMQRIASGVVIDAVGHDPSTPLVYALHQNYPNPFNPTTTISFSIAKAGTVSLVVYDLLGRSVTTLLNERLNSGSYQVPWDASALPSGMYFYRLNAGSFSDVKKVVLMK